MPALGLNITWGATDWSAFILERLHTESALLRAGARYVPIDGKTAVVPRLLDDGTAVWVDELQEIPSDAPEADTITLSPRKLGNVVSLSTESIEDSPVSELDAVGNALARSVAVAIDGRVFSAAAATAIAPGGLLPQMTAGIGPISFDNIVRAVGSIEAVGGVANVLFVNPTDLVTLRLVKTGDGSNQPVLQPDLTAAGAEQISGARVISTPALPAGTAVVGDARHIVVGVRRDVRVEFSAHARFTADAVVAKITARADWAVNDPRALVRMAAA
jgi:HK97 family phage major capsid protein